jgi:hypothetical protein
MGTGAQQTCCKVYICMVARSISEPPSHGSLVGSYLKHESTHLRSVESLSQSVASVSLSLRVARCKESPPRGSRRPPVGRFESALRASDVPTEVPLRLRLRECLTLWPLSPGRVSAR